METTGVHVDFGKVMQRMRELRAKMSANDSAKRFASMGVDVYQVPLLACLCQLLHACLLVLHQSCIPGAKNGLQFTKGMNADL